MAMAFLAAKQAGPQAAAAFLQGIQQHQQQAKQEQSQQLLQQSTLQTQAEQRRNLELDNARADEAAQRAQQQQQYSQTQDAIGSLDTYAQTFGDPNNPVSDPDAAQAAVTSRAAALAKAQGRPEDAFSSFVPQMAPVVSGKKKKQAQDLYERAEKTYGAEAMANDSITLKSEAFGDVKPSALRAMFAPQATTPTGDPAKPYVKPANPVNAGSLEDYIQRKYGANPTADQVLEARKTYNQIDDRPPVVLNIPGLTDMSPGERVETAAQAIIANRMAPSQLSTFFVGMGKDSASQLRSLVMQRVQQLKPDFNFAESEANFQFGKNTGTQNTVRYLQSVQESMPRVLAAAQTLANGKVRGINTLINAGKNQINDVDLKRFQTDVLLVADEVAKILQGGGTGSGTSDAKLRQASEILSTSDSPEAIAAALNEVNTLLGFREKSLTRGTFMEKPSAAGAKKYEILSVK